MLGLSISYIQRRYTLVNPVLDQLRVDKKEFDHYMTESVKTKTEQTIVSYLSGIVCEKYGEIINNNNLSDIQTHMLNMICQNTVRWINEIGKTVDGQYQLLNTYSTDDVSKMAGYREIPVDDRLLYVAECKQGSLVFLEYLWKIMLNICQKKVNNEAGISVFSFRLNAGFKSAMIVAERIFQFNSPEPCRVWNLISIGYGRRTR